MAREEHGPGQRAQRGREELGGLVVQVVGRLVEQERAGLADEERREAEARALTAREPRDQAAAVDHVEAQARQRAGGTGVGPPHVRLLGAREGQVVGRGEGIDGGGPVVRAGPGCTPARF